MKKVIIAALGAAVALVVAVAATAANGHANYRAVCAGADAGSASCHAMVVTDAHGNPLASSAPSGYGSVQFRSAYGLSTNSSATVAIVDAYDDPTAAQDLQTYSSQYNLPCSGCLTKVNQTGGTSYPRGNQGWALEISLDVQTVHAICPGCHILLVEAKTNSFSNLMAAEKYATSHASYVSNSWGGSESSSDTSYDGYFNQPGKVITVSSGDNGYGVEYPASSPYVVAVGGTTLNLTSSGAYGSETAWSSGGSGCSAYEPKPSWQPDKGCSKRTVADVAADADPNTGAAVYDSYGYSGQKGWFEVGGTSLASPLIASVFALSGNTGGASYLYSHAGSLHDVTSGSNGSCGGSYLCTAGTGYDGPTGLGTPDTTAGF